MSDHPPVSPKPRRHTARRFLLIAASILIVGLLVYYFICGMAYSEGTRSGVLIKISHKGYVFKTYEGEMNIGGFNQGDGTIMPAMMFRFSVADDSVYKKLDAMQGHKIVVRYKEVIHNFFWQGETPYFVEDATFYK
jgi:hypothetical protein